MREIEETGQPSEAMRMKNSERIDEPFVDEKRHKRIEEKFRLRLARDIEFNRLLSSNEALHAYTANLEADLKKLRDELRKEKSRRESAEAYAKELSSDNASNK